MTVIARGQVICSVWHESKKKKKRETTGGGYWRQFMNEQKLPVALLKVYISLYLFSIA